MLESSMKVENDEFGRCVVVGRNAVVYYGKSAGTGCGYGDIQRVERVNSNQKQAD